LFSYPEEEEEEEEEEGKKKMLQRYIYTYDLLPADAMYH